MSKGYVCPKCQGELRGPVCKDCGTDVTTLFADSRVDPTHICEVLAQGGAFVDRTTQNLFIPRHREWSATVVDPSNPTATAVATVGTIVRHRCQLSLRKFTQADVHSLLCVIGEICPDVFPRVDCIGDKPMVFLDTEQDTLYWPFTHDSPRGRLFDTGRYGLLYNGPILQPCRNGALDDFLATLRCATDDDRLLIKQWMLGGVGQSMMPPGQVPLLLMCGEEHGTGKSATMNMIAHYLGGPLEIVWHKRRMTQEDLNRRIMDPRNRVIVVDNVAPDPGEHVFDSDHLAHAVTAQEVHVKQLYKSFNVCRAPNFYLWGATANNPKFASELLNRSTVATLSADQPREDSWIETWHVRRRAVLEDLIQTAIDNWAEGPMPPPEKYCRFQTWQRVVQRLSRTEPVVIPYTSLAKSPLVSLLDDYWKEHHPGRQLAWTTFEAFLRMAKTGMGGVVNQQQGCSPSAIRRDLALYPSRYTMDDQWITRSE